MPARKREIDEFRTAELKLDGILVLAHAGSRNHYFCVPSETPSQCPSCGGNRIRNQGNMNRDYLDVILRDNDDDATLVTVSLEFRKSKCMSPACGSIFYPSFSFASRYSRTTHRLENMVVKMILEDGLSYTLISEFLGGKLSKQVIGQIYYRRMNELESNPDKQPEWFREYIKDDPDRLYRILRYRPRQRQNRDFPSWFFV